MEVNKENKERYGIIYKIENTVNGKCYIGQTTNNKGFNGRYHMRGNGIERVYKTLKANKEKGRYCIVDLLNDMDKYGLGSFKVTEELDVAYSREELDLLEKKYIKEFSCISNGYNSNYGGINGNHSNKTKIKMSKARKGKYAGENHPLYGKRHSLESREKMSKSSKGKNAGEKHPLYGKHLTEEIRKKISESKKGKTLSQTTKDKMSKTRRGKNNPRAKKVICLIDGYVFNTINECAEYYKKTDRL